MPSEYAVSSIKPKGEKKRIVSGGISFNSGAVVAIEANANPVDHAEKRPQTIPNPGINMGSAMVVLWVNIPNASMSKTSFSNSAINSFASSSLTVDMEPIWNVAENKIKKMKKVVNLDLFTSRLFF